MSSPDAWVLNAPKGLVVASEFVFMIRNRGYRPGTKMGFIYFAGKSAGAWNMTGFGPAFELARRGYPVICGDCGDTASAVGQVDGPGVWGSDAAQTKASSYVTWLQNTFGAKAGKIGLLYGSHGCALAYAWAKANTSKVQLIAGAIGTVDVEDIRANNRGTGSGYQASIEAAYTDNAGWQAARPTHNPTELVASLGAVPQLDYYSDTDPICVLATHQAFATAAGVNLEQHSLGSVGHATTGLGPPGGAAGATYNSAFADWCEAHAA